MKVGDCMKRDVISITATATIGHAAEVFVANRIGTLPVVDDFGRLVGLVLLRDLLALVMPDFVRLLEDFDFVRDFGAVEARLPSPEILARPVRQIMQPPIAAQETSGLLRAAAKLRQHDLLDLPVVAADGRLVGIASRVDIGTALLESWGTPSGGQAP